MTNNGIDNDDLQKFKQFLENNYSPDTYEEQIELNQLNNK